uniref:Uncharacterized protein n=1 Tax=Anguilla anguilla TaxID=7936 RepID=A0A0E9S976_ANGAN
MRFDVWVCLCIIMSVCYHVLFVCIYRSANLGQNPLVNLIRCVQVS